MGDGRAGTGGADGREATARSLGADGDALREARLRRELGRWRSERVLAVVFIVWATTLGGLALAGRVDVLSGRASALWWLYLPALVALPLGLRAGSSPWSRRKWAAGARSPIAYSRAAAARGLVARGDPVPRRDRGLAVDMLLSDVELPRMVVWITLAQCGVFAVQIDPLFPEAFEVLRLILASLFLALCVGGVIGLERQTRRATTFLAHDPDPVAP